MDLDDGGRVQCCIAGGGPAGMMFGYLLARAEHVRPPEAR
jgi:hypothetical protein